MYYTINVYYWTLFEPYPNVFAGGVFGGIEELERFPQQAGNSESVGELNRSKEPEALRAPEVCFFLFPGSKGRGLFPRRIGLQVADAGA